MEPAAMEFLRALRGARSQIAFARRLGYKRNPICDWEHGRRFPTVVEVHRAAGLVGVDLGAVYARFVTPDVPPPAGYDTNGLSAWLRALRGQSPLGEVAAKAGVSRFVASRWLSGATTPRLPDFLRLLEALTGRVSDWVAGFVPIAHVPTLLPSFERRAASRRLAAEMPWSEAVLRVLETGAYAGLLTHDDGWVAARLGVSAATVAGCLTALASVGAIAWDGVRFVAAAPLTVDTRSAPELVRALKGHWAGVGQARAASPRAGDLLSYNVISLSRHDLARLRELHLAYYRDVRALVSASEPVEVAALVNVQLITFD